MTNNGGGGSGGMSMNLAGGQVISTSPGAYIMDNAAPHPVSQTARASPATVSRHRPLIVSRPRNVNALSLCYFIHRCTSWIQEVERQSLEQSSRFKLNMCVHVLQMSVCTHGTRGTFSRSSLRVHLLYDSCLVCLYPW